MLKAYKGIDFDDDNSYEKSKMVLKNKKCLFKNYYDSYTQMKKLADKYLTEEGVELELGSGGGFMKDLFPDIVTSDVKDVNGVDKVIDARNIPFDNETIRAIYATHVLHHIPDVTMFFSELQRTCKSGGGAVFIEPYWSPMGRLFFSKFHPEKYDERQKKWSFESKGAMSSANQALSYIVFKRDKELFQKRFPQLELVYDRPFNGLRYVATGGLWLNQLLPDFIINIIAQAETALWPLMYFFGLHHIFVVRKK